MYHVCRSKTGSEVWTLQPATRPHSCRSKAGSRKSRRLSQPSCTMYVGPRPNSNSNSKRIVPPTHLQKGDCHPPPKCPALHSQDSHPLRHADHRHACTPGSVRTLDGAGGLRSFVYCATARQTATANVSSRPLIANQAIATPRPNVLHCIRSPPTRYATRRHRCAAIALLLLLASQQESLRSRRLAASFVTFAPPKRAAARRRLRRKTPLDFH
jgi:hypothetical protein